MNKNTIYKNIDLKNFNSWKVGGKAEQFLICDNKDTLASYIKTRKIKPPITFIGLGSNLLIRDGGVKGAVVIMHGGLSVINRENELIYVEAGVSCSKLAKFAAKEGLNNSAFFAGIPGTIGGSLAMNAGCYGSETWDYVNKVLMINLNGDQIVRSRADFKINYRDVKNYNNDESFLAAWFNFPEGNKEDAEKKIKDLLAHRKNTQPLNWPTAGSTFRNPIDNFAAKLIEDCGLKGYQIGGAKVSEKHANFIINIGNATALDIENIITYIQKIVFEKKNIQLFREIKIIGEQIGT
ncbi:UDP-N-acetylmuramate dehydrogenase [Methylophilaceae bacterium]|nr:UDP-N-acetylmuramate dehydrogenase [Methylophilaceae bacterium]